MGVLASFLHRESTNSLIIAVRYGTAGGHALYTTNIKTPYHTIKGYSGHSSSLSVAIGKVYSFDYSSSCYGHFSAIKFSAVSIADCHALN